MAFLRPWPECRSSCDFGIWCDQIKARQNNYTWQGSGVQKNGKMISKADEWDQGTEWNIIEKCYHDKKWQEFLGNNTIATN